MARVVYTQLPLDTTDAADLNAILSAVATETAAVDGENMREGGLDRDVFATGIAHVKAFVPVVNTVTSSQTLSTTWVTCDPGGVNPIQSATGFSLGARDLVRIRGSIELLTNGTNPGIAAGDQIDVRVAFQRDALPVASITPVVGYTADLDTRCVIPVLAVLTGATNQGTINQVYIQVSDQSGNAATVQYGRVQLQATVFRGLSV
jgi:hypothetical protein